MKKRSQAATGASMQLAEAQGKLRFMAAGGLLGALAASSCCIAPLVLCGLDISGSWIANLTALEPYQPVFLALSAGFLGTGYYLAYRKPQASCGEGGVCVRPLPRRLVMLALWTATALTAAAAAFPHIAPRLLGV